jgi:hypothetical protein
MMPEKQIENEGADADRRAFLVKAGRFAVIVPPAMTVLLSTTMTSNAIAKSGGTSYNPPHPSGPPQGLPHPDSSKLVSELLEDVWSRILKIFGQG